MLSIASENVGDMAILKCDGRLVQSDAAFKLRQAVIAEADARVIVLDLTEVHAIEGGGLGMLWALQRWADDQGIELKLFNPIGSVKNRLEHYNAMMHFHIASVGEMIVMLATQRAGEEHAHAA